MKLIMIHGRAQGGKDPQLLKQEWLDALYYGCKRARVEIPANTVIEFPFYGDLLDDLVAKADVPLGHNLNPKGAFSNLDEALRGEILAQIAENAGISDSDVLLEFSQVPLERGPGNWEWVQGIIRTLDRIPGLNSRFIDMFTRDVFTYLTYPSIRRQIDAAVASAFDEGPCVILAHSLGTIIAYNILLKRKADPRSPRLVTVGSPLGIRAIKAHLENPLISPPCLENWFNAYDDRDLVALQPLDSKNFHVTPAIENKSDVKNFTDNRHGITGYLSDPVVAQKIAQFL